MNVNVLKSKNGRVEDVIAESPGFIIFGDCDSIKDFLTKSVQESMLAAKEASKSNP